MAALRRPRAAAARRLALARHGRAVRRGALGLLAYQEDYSIDGFFKKQTESVDGFEVLERAFPAGALGPTTVLVVREGGAATGPPTSRPCGGALDGVPGVAAVEPVERSSDGRSRSST